MSSSTTTPPGAAPGEEPTVEFAADLPPAEPTAEQIVASPAVEGDLNAEMRRAAKPFSRSTLVLAGLLVVAIAFAGGAWTHAAFGSSSPSTPTRQAGGTQGGTQAGAGQGGFRGAGG